MLHQKQEKIGDTSQTVPIRLSMRPFFCFVCFQNFSIFQRKWIPCGNLGATSASEKFSSRFCSRSGNISCAAHTLSDGFNDNDVKSEHGELVRGSDPPLIYSFHSTVGDVWRAATTLLLHVLLAAGLWKTETNTLDRRPTGNQYIFERILRKATGQRGGPLTP